MFLIFKGVRERVPSIVCSVHGAPDIPNNLHSTLTSKIAFQIETLMVKLMRV